MPVSGSRADRGGATNHASGSSLASLAAGKLAELYGRIAVGVHNLADGGVTWANQPAGRHAKPRWR
ncbi:hypothetical protein STHU_14520 [Allostella humosa]|nr:hypothetical protein STHU_14520 [Stella humosa]